MVNSKGYRARTRHTFQRGFRKHGTIKLSTYFTDFRLGDVVDVKANGAIHKGMPHKFYHGKTGVVWNISPQAIGVELNKQVRNRIVKKRIHVRVEHLKKSRSSLDFIARRARNEQLKRDAKKTGVKAVIKRQPIQPREGEIIKSQLTSIETIHAIPYELVA
ncbi:60S large subunit ribosomal protein eL21 (rpL21) [Andalucia godoyi]|uniref:60S large subunit ribosomal protein eL21 (RpL21) n=1 Tax=Andalucia godoyi TaxID=505711 RepID=A0A8K0F2I1_ANDGO|nr:60S large subunit ribosomal protein eL21 (rpL21) [Andalucia godoyi]|eukprot:ANDGO_04786.mRNA.1 60S large subunit ribosomal protein eL21 (rpL21)